MAKLSKEQIKNMIYDILANKLSINISKIKDNSKIVEDLGADSIDIVELVMSAEETFEVQIPDKDVHKFKIVKDIIDYVSKLTLYRSDYIKFKIILNHKIANEPKAPKKERAKKIKQY